MLIKGLGLDKDALIAFITDSRPSYAQFEAWIASQPGVKLDATSVSAPNALITGYHYANDVRATILDDWSKFHAVEFA